MRMVPEFATALAIAFTLAGCGGNGSSSISSTPQVNAPSAGGSTVISIPSAASIVCSPVSVLVGVNQTNVLECVEQGFGGAFTWSVANPSIASVQQSDSLRTFFNVTGLQSGTTAVSFHSQTGGTGSVTITVAP